MRERSHPAPAYLETDVWDSSRLSGCLVSALSGASHILGFILKLKFQSLFLTLHPQTVVLSAFWAAVVREYPSWKEERNIMRRSNSSPHLAFEL